MNKEQKQIEQFTNYASDMAYPLFIDNGQQWVAACGLTKLEVFTKDIVAKMVWATPHYLNSNNPHYETLVNTDLSPIELAQIVKAVNIAKATLAELEKTND